MSAVTVREQIIDYVIETTESSSLGNVHVSKLVKELEINRNTFYYHFDSKLDVAIYVFRTDLAKVLTARIPQDYLIETELPLKPGPNHFRTTCTAKSVPVFWITASSSNRSYIA